MKILKAMQHDLTQTQKQEIALMFMGNDLGDDGLPLDIEAEAVEIHNLKDVKTELFNALANCPADKEVLEELALCLSAVCMHFDAVILPIGSPAFMFAFSTLCKTPVLFSHSERVSKEVTDDSGTVTKTSVFEHIRFIFINHHNK